MIPMKQRKGPVGIRFWLVPSGDAVKNTKMSINPVDELERGVKNVQWGKTQALKASKRHTHTHTHTHTEVQAAYKAPQK